MNRSIVNSDRRDFLKTAAATGAGLSLAASSSVLSAAIAASRSPNDTLRVAIMGVNGYGARLARTFALAAHAEVGWICDVDSRVIGRVIEEVTELQGRQPQATRDFRRLLENPQLDALVIATPNHWHVPATILALQAGKHVYVEKPASHNAYESELVAEAQRKYNRLVQMGNQQRSHRASIEIIQRIHQGLIGRTYQARAWYANTRSSIGRGKSAPVPAELDYDLWQGPAPRQPYRDNIIHYNWHWLKHWGNGEIGNNGVHELDIARWALAADFPTRVTSVGGRFHFEDDWEFPDTQDAGFEFTGGKSLVWQSRSCNGFPLAGRTRGVSVHGTEGTVIMDRASYEVYDLDNELVESHRTPAPGTPLEDSTGLHVTNFIAAIRTGAKLRSPIADAQKSVLLAHLGNIAQQTTGALQIDPETGRIRDNREAMALWGRKYQPGWKPALEPAPMS